MDSDTLQSNNNFIMYKRQLIKLGFRHKEAKMVLKYIIKYYEHVLYDSINLADIYYFNDLFFMYEQPDPFSKIVSKIFNKWIRNNNDESHNNYESHNYYFNLFNKLCCFGEFTPWFRIDVSIERINIAKMLSIYYHKKDILNDDILIFKDIIDSNPLMFSSKTHSTHFFEKISKLYKTKQNWEIFINLNHKLPQELLDIIYEYLNI